MRARQITAAPVSSSRGMIPAVCGSCSRITSAVWIRGGERVGVAGARALVCGVFARPERLPVVGAVEAVVEVLGDAEELGVAVHDDPLHVDALAPRT